METASAPAAADTARDLGLESEAVEDAYRRLADRHVIVLKPGSLDILMANPFSGVPTPFVVNAHGGRSYFGNCVWDGLGILAALRSDGHVKTSCPDCGDRLALIVRGGRLEPSNALVHYAVPAAHWWDDIGFA